PPMAGNFDFPVGAPMKPWRGFEGTAVKRVLPAHLHADRLGLIAGGVISCLSFEFNVSTIVHDRTASGRLARTRCIRSLKAAPGQLPRLRRFISMKSKMLKTLTATVALGAMAIATAASAATLDE